MPDETHSIEAVYKNKRQFLDGKRDGLLDLRNDYSTRAINCFMYTVDNTADDEAKQYRKLSDEIQVLLDVIDLEINALNEQRRADYIHQQIKDGGPVEMTRTVLDVPTADGTVIKVAGSAELVNDPTL